MKSGWKVLLSAGLLGNLLLSAACQSQRNLSSDPAGIMNGNRDEYFLQRQYMVEKQLAGRDINQGRVLDAMRRVQRHLFVPADLQGEAYADHPLPIGFGQTISQPYIVAFMTQALHLKEGEKVLEIGTGSGYQAAILAEMGAIVYSIEIVEPLAKEAETRLTSLGYGNVYVRAGDGYGGWPEQAPFDAVIVTAAPESIPQPLVQQLAMGGRMIIPVGGMVQELILLEKRPDGVHKKDVLPVRFVPMTGKIQTQR